MCEMQDPKDKLSAIDNGIVGIFFDINSFEKTKLPLVLIFEYKLFQNASPFNGIEFACG